jgi:hypothetical protein
MTGACSPVRAIVVAGVLAAAAFALAGCAPRTRTAAPTPTPGARPRSTAVLAILSPEPGAIIHGKVLHVRLQLTGAKIVPYTSTHITPDQGHIHLYIDGKVVSMLYGLDQTIPVAPGTHLLQAEFVATDHFPFNPRVMRTVTFTVR